MCLTRIDLVPVRVLVVVVTLLPKYVFQQFGGSSVVVYLGCVRRGEDALGQVRASVGVPSNVRMVRK